MFEVLERNGLARTGKWILGEQNTEVVTPNILFVEGERIKVPDEAEILISEKKPSREKPFLISSESLFSGDKENINDYMVSPSLIYPPSQVELNTYAAKINKEKFSGKVFVVTGRGEVVVDAVKGVEAEVYVLANSLHLVKKPNDFVQTIVNLRKAIGYQKLIYTPGLGSPTHIALLVYCGVDLFDSVPLFLNARLRNFLTADGKANKNEIGEDFCFCPSCLDGKRDFDSILAHNYYASLSETKVVKNAIRNGRLRELVEARIRSEPWMVSVLRTFDTHYYSFQERYFPVTGGQMIAASNDSLQRPEIVRFRERVKERYKKPSHKKILLFLPCSAKKPYSFSRTHKALRKAIAECGNRNVVHEVIITSPLGVVPREVELFYPAQQYDIPVTRTWSKDEISMIGEGITEFLKTNDYEAIVVHLPPDYVFIQDFLDDFTNTCDGNPTSSSSLQKLKDILKETVKHYEKVDWRTELGESIKSFARFQFGNAGEALTQDAEIKGRYPNLRIFRKDKQIGMLVGKRGLISLTLEGGKILAEGDSYRVKIHDFTPKGNIFAVGVKDADEDIRIGDDVVVLKDNELVGVGVAVMSPKEMIESDRGEAVRIRHLVKSGDGK
jgi:archaeosine synthase